MKGIEILTEIVLGVIGVVLIWIGRDLDNTLEEMSTPQWLRNIVFVVIVTSGVLLLKN